MINRHAFDMADKVKVEKDANNAINMYAGADQFLNIGEPEVRGLLTIIGRRHERQSFR
jgi:hypothetical protein